MAKTEQDQQAMHTISDVERDIGVAKETLRVWERRYGFPQPERDENGERLYPPVQVERLRLVKRLLDQGFRPGKVMPLNTEDLAELAGRSIAEVSWRPDDPDLGACLLLIKEHRLAELRQRMAQVLLQKGMRGFVLDLMAPLTAAVGDEWAAGKLAVFEEHLYAETVQSVMRSAIYATTMQPGHAAATPRILLTTVPQERHGLGLLMAEALFALEGAHCVSLGVQTPLAEIVEAARVQQADVVALSFSSVMSPRAAVENITELQSRLGQGVVVWAGGSSATLARRQLGPSCVLDLDAIPAAVARWRGRQRLSAP
jgi:DNA-binding transcriptional MerR regulator/methylmalonyl-CoA mutase cobalamin-binding subunit